MASLSVTPEHLSPNVESEGSSARSSSPDGNCPICLGKVNNKAFTDACFHTFCFVCLLEWSKIRATCPLCKTTFKSIIHNVVSNDVYDQYHLKPAESRSVGTDGSGRRFRYSTTLTEEHRVELTWRRNRALERRYQRAHQVHLQAASEERRRLIYRAGLWVRHMGSNRYTRFRDISTEFFHRNPAMTHRLVPWLRRDLSILFSGEDHVTFMTQYILSLLPNVHLQTEEFHDKLRPFLYSQTDHFIHELVSFARSPYDMNTYDQIAQYDFTAAHPTQRTSSQPLSALQGSSDYNDVISLSSDDEVIEIPTLSSLLRSDGSSSSISQAASEQVEALDLSSTHNPEPPSIRPDPDQPGPSGFFLNQPVQVKPEPTVNLNIISDDDSDVEIVSVLKPYEERTPEYVILVSSSTEEEQAESRHAKQGGKRHQKRKHTLKVEESQGLEHSPHPHSRSVDHNHDGHTHRHSHKRKHKDSRHHKHGNSSTNTPLKDHTAHRSSNLEERSSHNSSRSRSTSKSTVSSSSYHSSKSNSKDGDSRTKEHFQDHSRKGSSSPSHGSHSRRHKSENINLSLNDNYKDHQAETVGAMQETQRREISSKERERWKLLWRDRNKNNVVSGSVSRLEHCPSNSREHAGKSEEPAHDRRHEVSHPRKHKCRDSEDGRERTKSRRLDESQSLHLTMVLSHNTTKISDRHERSSSSTDVLSVMSSHSRHKHKKHKRHRSRRDKETKIHSSSPHIHMYTSSVFGQEDRANDGDESSTSTEEETDSYIQSNGLR